MAPGNAVVPCRDTAEEMVTAGAMKVHGDALVAITVERVEDTGRGEWHLGGLIDGNVHLADSLVERRRIAQPECFMPDSRHRLSGDLSPAEVLTAARIIAVERESRDPLRCGGGVVAHRRGVESSRKIACQVAMLLGARGYCRLEPFSK